MIDAIALSKLPENLVARGVAELVVDRLEVVDVEENHAERRLLAQAPGQLTVHRLLQVPAVVEPRQRVAVRLLAQLGLQGVNLVDAQVERVVGRLEGALA